MDVNTALTILIGFAGVAGGYVGGKRNSSLATDTISLLQSQVTALQSQCSQIPALHERIAVLEELVTQRAKVNEVLEIVTEIKEKMERG